MSRVAQTSPDLEPMPTSQGILVWTVVMVEWIPRKLNHVSDWLASMAMDMGAGSVAADKTLGQEACVR